MLVLSRLVGESLRIGDIGPASSPLYSEVLARGVA